MAARPERTVLWRPCDGLGLEHAELAQGRDGDGWTLTGTTLLAVAGEPAHVSYRVDLAPDWTTRAVSVVHRQGSDATARELHLVVDERRRWSIGRRPGAGALAARVDPALTGLADVDLEFSPATNTLPIRRLTPPIDEAVDVVAAWVRFPGLTVEPLAQRYRRLGERRYRYETADGSFAADLEVDALGLVVRYENGWHRIAESAPGPP